MKTKMHKMVDAVLYYTKSICSMMGAGRHIRHTQKLAKMLRDRAGIRRIACAYAKAERDEDAAKKLDEVIEYVKTGDAKNLTGRN
uniref:Uncharacterized protein n=1 Tax=viral metagenome TaxID=1070528 RepID=A0A6M3LSB8_9ZZZZ